MAETKISGIKFYWGQPGELDKLFSYKKDLVVPP